MRGYRDGMTDPWHEDGAAGEVAATAAALGAEARQVLPGFPWVVTGTVDGRSWLLRERSGLYTVSVAPDGDPGGDPDGRDAVTLRTGSDVELASPAAAVRLAVGTVRTHLRQAACVHGAAPPGARCCPACGLPLVDPATP